MRVLIATVTAGGGHLAAAAALQEAWQARRPGDTLRQVDLADFFSPLHRKLHADGYTKLVEHAPELWGMVFSRTDDTTAARRLNQFRRWFTLTSRNRFRRLVREFQPEAVLCTHYLPVTAIGELKGPAAGCPPFLVSVVTDFEAHAVWMDAAVDLYCVAFDETAARLVARGAAPDRIAATGIPISSRFLAPPEPGAARRQLGLRDDVPVVLVLGGGFGMGPVAQIAQALDQVEKPIQMVVIAGRNQELRRELATVDFRHPTHVKGFASNMQEWMAAADLIISKPGGLTSSEALACGRPLLIAHPIPGQESANSDYLLERGAAVKINRVEDLPYRVSQLLGSGQLKRMATAARRLGRPKAADSICTEVLARFPGPAASP